VNRNVAVTWTTRRPAAEVRHWIETSVGRTLRKAGYRVDSSTADQLVMSRSGTQWPLAMVSVLAFWMSNSGRQQVVFAFRERAGEAVEVFIAGQVPGKLAGILEDLARAPAAARR